MKKIRYCGRCVMPETRPDLTINEAGICDACLSTQRKAQIRWDERKARLTEILERFRSKDGHNYDCIIPVSGGKDSHFQVYLLKKVFGVNPLCVNFTPCAVSEVGKRNLQNLTNMGVDLLQVRVNSEVHKKLAKIGLTQVGDVCWPEHVGIFTVPIRVAVSYNIPLVVWGENPQFEYGGPLASKDNYILDRRWMEEFGGFLGLRVEDVVGTDGLTKNDLLPFTYPSREELDRVGIESTFLGSYIRWDFRQSAEAAINNGFAVNPDGLCEGTYVDFYSLDCVYHPIHDYFKFLKFGFGRATDHACQDIREGRMSRAQAMEMVRKYDGRLPVKAIAAFMQDVKMTEREFLEIADSFTNKSIFRTDASGNLLRDEEGNLIKVNYDNNEEPAEQEPPVNSYSRGCRKVAHQDNGRRVAIIDYGMGNISSVAKVFEATGCDVLVTTDYRDMKNASHIVLPGVGAFPDAMANLKRLGIIAPLTEEVMEKGKPFLGICLGMQLLAQESDENGVCEGLGWIPATVTELQPSDENLKVPHIGWNDVQLKNNSLLYQGLEHPVFYFVHSYHVVCAHDDIVTGTFEYGGTFTASITCGNIHAVQFHPEKSQKQGLQIIGNFLRSSN
jgi:imidazole glycerol phosphate synthase glutamine amidotransferase subunit